MSTNQDANSMMSNNQETKTDSKRISKLIETSKEKKYPNIDYMLKFEQHKIVEQTIVLKSMNQSKPLRLLDDKQVLKKTFDDCILLLLTFPRNFSKFYPTIDLSKYKFKIYMRNGIVLNNIKFKFEYSLFDPSVIVKNEKNYIIDDNEDCSICFCPFGKKVTILSCGHHFHEKCIKKWVFRKLENAEHNKLRILIAKSISKISCPICKKNLFEEIHSAYKKTMTAETDDEYLEMETGDRIKLEGNLLSTRNSLALRKILLKDYNHTHWGQFILSMDCWMLNYFNYKDHGKFDFDIDIDTDRDTIRDVVIENVRSISDSDSSAEFDTDSDVISELSVNSSLD